MPTRKSGLLFNGSSTTLTPASTPTSAVNNFWMAAWIMPLVLPQVAGMIMFNGNDSGGWGMAISNGAGLSGSRLTGLAGSVAWVNPGTPGDLTVNVRVHVAIIRRANVWEFYVNGVQTITALVTVPLTPTAGRASIGYGLNSSNGSFRYFNGRMDAAMMGTGAPSAADMSNLYRWGVRPANCVLDYEMDEMTGTTLADSSPSGITGTLVNGTWISDQTIISPFPPSFN